jgi:hypothetical protein
MPLFSTLGSASRRGFGRALYSVSKYFATSSYTAESIPSNSIFINQEGYSGSIPLTSYTDTNGYTSNSTVSQTFNTSSYTAEAIPPTSISINQDGYVGSIPRTSFSDTNGYTSNSTQTQYFSSSQNYTITTYYLTNPWYFWSETNSNPPPSSVSINQNGYVGSIPKISDQAITSQTQTTQPSEYAGRDYVIYQQTFQASYGGNLSKTVSTYIPRYTGYYSGTLSKTVSTYIPRYTGYYSGSLSKTVPVYIPRYTGYYGGSLSKLE